MGATNAMQISIAVQLVTWDFQFQNFHDISLSFLNNTSAILSMFLYSARVKLLSSCHDPHSQSFFPQAFSHNSKKHGIHDLILSMFNSVILLQ